MSGQCVRVHQISGTTFSIKHQVTFITGAIKQFSEPLSAVMCRFLSESNTTVSIMYYLRK